MVAVPASQPSCRFCDQELKGRLAPHLCEACGQPQPVLAGEGGGDYFQLFGVARRFAQDRGALEKRFYELSRALHPDRFSRKPDAPGAPAAHAMTNSLARMSLINQAYSTLKSPAELRAYLLTLEGLGVADQGGAKGQMPTELAEAWFELQDVLSESPEQAGPKIAAFETDLKQALEESVREVEQLEKDYDREPRRAPLEAMRAKLLSQNYMNSLSRDIGRVVGKK